MVTDRLPYMRISQWYSVELTMGDQVENTCSTRIPIYIQPDLLIPLRYGNISLG